MRLLARLEASQICRAHSSALRRTPSAGCIKADADRYEVEHLRRYSSSNPAILQKISRVMSLARTLHESKIIDHGTRRRITSMTVYAVGQRQQTGVVGIGRVQNRPHQQRS